MNVDTLLTLAPKFHEDERGRAVSWGLADDALHLIERLGQPGDVTLETGAGFSTLVFASRGCTHTAITPDGNQIERIQRFAGEHFIDLSRVTFCIDYSQKALPELSISNLAVALIDGDHAFPAPFIDWYYTATRMRIGGHMIVDDTHLWTGKILKQFMGEDSAWKAVANLRRTSVFQKTAEMDVQEGWVHQRFVSRRSPSPTASAVSDGLRLLRKGALREVIARTRDRFTR